MKNNSSGNKPGGRLGPWYGASLALIVGAVGIVALLAFRADTAQVMKQEAAILTGQSKGLSAAVQETESTFTAGAPPVTPELLPVGVHNYDVALSNAIDARLRSGNASESDRRHPFDDLALNYPEKMKEIRAHEMRFATMGDIGVKRDNDVMAYFGESTMRPSPLAKSGLKTLPEPHALQAFLEACDQGAELDRENAYFPAMKAMALFSNYQDGEALKVLHNAAQCKNWDDYSWDEAEARWRSLSRKPGANSLARTMVLSSILFPHFARLRSIARLTDMIAAQKETSGKRLEGLQIRQDTLALGRNMRLHSRNLIGGLVGIAISSLAFAHPDKTLYGGLDKLAFEKLDSKQKSNVKLEVYNKFAKSLGHPEAVTAAEHEIQAGNTYRSISERADGSVQDPFGGEKLREINRSWMVASLSLANAGWLIVLAIACATLVGLRADKSAASAMAIGILAAVAIIVTLSSHWGVEMSKLDKALLNLTDSMTFSNTNSDSESGFNQLRQSPAYIQGSMLVGSLIGPLMVLCAAAAAKLFSGKESCYTMARGALGIAAILAVCTMAFCFTAVKNTARLEAEQHNRLDRLLQNEGRYRAELAHVKLPE